jgi:uncharacterized Tic20 family protein
MQDLSDGTATPGVTAPRVPVADKSEYTWAAMCHLAALAGFFLPIVGNIVGPLVVWLIKKNEMPFVDRQGKEALNFQISVTIYLIASFILWLVIIGMLLTIGIAIAALVFTIIAAVKSSNGEDYRYPLTIRLIK